MRCPAVTAIAWLALVAVVACPPVSVLKSRSNNGQQSAPAETVRSGFLKWYAAQPRISLPIDSGGAKVLLVLFVDYRAVPCESAFELIEEVLRRPEFAPPGTVRFVVKAYPIDPECNPAVADRFLVLDPQDQEQERRRYGRGSCLAAAAIRLAPSADRAVALRRALFMLGSEAVAKDVEVLASAVGRVKDVAKQYPTVRRVLERDAALGRALGVTSVPVLFVNGVRIVGVLRSGLLEVALDRELQR
jgi:protein-disulfide isomerase